MARTTMADLKALIEAQQAQIAQLMAAQTPTSQPKAKAPKKHEKPTGPFAKFTDKQILEYLVKVFAKRSRDTGIWLYSTHVGRKRAIWNMAFQLTYVAGYRFTHKAADYARAILAGDPQNEPVLEAIRKAK